MTLELVEEQKVEAGLIGKDIAMVQHQVQCKVGRKGGAWDADSEWEDVGEGAHEQLVVIHKFIDGIFSTTAEKVVGFCWRCLRIFCGWLLQGVVECVEEALIRIMFFVIGGRDDDNVAHDKGQTVRDACTVEVYLRPSGLGKVCS